ncbi:MAG TPA: SapB/AmfS family lanthipeptide [Solirubrobacteraceae bacterium]|jgi:hypothetical protein
MSILDLQGLEPEGGSNGGGSTLTAILCESKTPSNLSVAACH